MAECSGNRGGDGGVLIGLVAGTLIGAAGLGLWLLKRADERRLSPGLAPLRRRNAAEALDGEDGDAGFASSDGELHDKVQRLNLAIDDVRRQLETLGNEGPVHR